MKNNNEIKAKTYAASKIRQLAATKLISRELLVEILKQRIVVTKGTFDILHSGHLALFSFCREIASRLGEKGFVLVIVESDSSVRVRKGSGRPFQTEQERAEQVALLPWVDSVLVLGAAELPSLLAAIKPACYVKGMDTAIGAELESHETEIELDPAKNQELIGLSGCDVVVFTDDGALSTSKLVARIRNTSTA
jgi:cytidyltransferase-like protein